MSPWSSWSRTKTEPKSWLAKRVTGFYISWNMLTIHQWQKISYIFLFYQFLFYYANCSISFNFFLKIWLPNYTAVSQQPPVSSFTHTQYIFHWGHTPAMRHFWQLGRRGNFPNIFYFRPNFHIRKHISRYIQFKKIYIVFHSWLRKMNLEIKGTSKYEECTIQFVDQLKGKKSHLTTHRF